jgi:hypothetical protein
VEVYVKLMGAIRNREFGLVAELFCTMMARELGLGFLRPFVVNFSAEFLRGVPKEAQDVVRRSVGLNFGSETGAGPIWRTQVKKDIEQLNAYE